MVEAVYISTCAHLPLYMHTCISVMRLAPGGGRESLGHAAENCPLAL